MTDNHDARDGVKGEYAQKLAALQDDGLVEEVNRQVWLSAFASNNPRAPAHWKVDECYDETRRRAKPWLYQRGYNQAYAACGFAPSADDIEAEKGPALQKEDSSHVG